MVVHHPVSEAAQVLPAPHQGDQVRCADRRGRVQRRERGGGIPAQRTQRRTHREDIVGGSSSGRSAGFLTPDSGLELHQLVRRYGTQAAAEIWEAPCRGIDRLVSTIKEFDVECGLIKQDSLFLGLARQVRKPSHPSANVEKALDSPINALTTRLN